MNNTIHNPTLRVLNVLEILSIHNRGLSLTEISNILHIPKGTLSPILHTLLNNKFIFYNENNSKYSIGIMTYCIGTSYSKDLTALDFIKNEMKYIVKETNEICQMGILINNQVLYIAKFDCESPIRIISSVGKKFPAYCTALGKALLSHKSLEELKLIYPIELKAFTKNTITDLNLLEIQLKEIRETSIASEIEEINEQTACIAVPLIHKNKILASISVSFPIFRVSHEKLELIKSTLLSSKERIETFFYENNIMKLEQIF